MLFSTIPQMSYPFRIQKFAKKTSSLRFYSLYRCYIKHTIYKKRKTPDKRLQTTFTTVCLFQNHRNWQRVQNSRNLRRRTKRYPIPSHCRPNHKPSNSQPTAVYIFMRINLQGNTWCIRVWSQTGEKRFYQMYVE